MKLTQVFSNFLTLRKHGESGGKATFNGAEVGPPETVSTMAALINGAGAITTPGDTDRFGFRDSASGLFAYVTFANFKTTLLTWLQGLFISLLSSVNTQTGTTYTILTSDLGKDVRFTSATAVTLTLASYAGFPEGFQCVLHNDSANAVDVTLSGTVVASGTKIAQKKSALLRMVGGSWRCSGGLS